VGRYTMQYRLMATHYPSAIHYRIGLCQSKHQWKRHASAPILHRRHSNPMADIRYTKQTILRTAPIRHGWHTPYMATDRT